MSTVIKIKYKQIIKKSIEEHIFPLYFLLSYICQEKKARKRVRKLTQTWKVKPLSALNISHYKKSDTLFVLGSGESINKLGLDAWDVIKRNDTVGFNYWLIHDFVPTYYVFEPPRNQERAIVLLRNISLRAKDYKETPIIMKDAIDSTRFVNLELIPNELIKNFYISADISIPGNSEESIVKSLNYCNLLGFFAKTDRIQLMLKKRASLSYMILFGLIAGYKEIVLCGVDLNNTNCFYESNKDYYQSKGFTISHSVQTGKIHKTIDPDYGILTIDKIIYILNDELLKPRGINLYIASKSSALYPRLPIYW